MSDMMDFDPAAFGLPSGFGAKKGNNKPKQAAFHERTKRVDIAKENGDGIAKDVRELGVSRGLLRERHRSADMLFVVEW